MKFLNINKHRNKIVIFISLLVVLLFGVFILFYKLGSVPSGFYIDEALPAYNAYSILLTGKDEYGKLLPFLLRFYGSYNPPLYTYLSIAPIYLFGLNMFSARFVSALFGLFTSIFVFGLLYSSGNFLKGKFTAIIGTLLFLLSPWLILHSRVGYEISLGLFLFTGGVFFAWLSLRNKIFLVFSAVLLSLSTYAAYSQLILAPIFILVFVLVFRKEIFIKPSRSIKIAFILLILTQLPHLFLLTTPAFFPKSDLTYQSGNVFNLVREILSHYFTYFSPRSLFAIGDPDLQRSIPLLATFYPWMVVPYFAGFYFIYKERKNQFVKFLIIFLLITPIPASLTRDPFSTHRAISLLIPLICVMTVGIDGIFVKIRPITRIALLIIVFSLSLFSLWRSYFVFLPQERAKAWGYGDSQLTDIILDNKDKHFLIDSSRVKPLYINLAFFMKYPPSELQKVVDQTIKDNYYYRRDFNPNYRFANIEIRNIKWKEDIYKDQIIVGDEYAVSSDQVKEHFLTKIFEIDDPVGRLVFVGYKTNPKIKCANTDYKSIYCKIGYKRVSGV